jgi:dTDP-4-amino-4,6-dideoxygalactose transaminase
VATPEVGASYVLFRCTGAAESQRVRDSLSRAGVGHRLWYGRGLQAHSAFAAAPRDRLAVTESLAPCLVGLPLAPDLPEATIAYVADALARSMEGAS